MNHHTLTIESLTLAPHTCISPKNDVLSTFFELECSFSWDAMRKNLPPLSSLEMIKEILYNLSSRTTRMNVIPATFIKNYSEQINPYDCVALRFLYPWLAEDYEHSILQNSEHSVHLENIIKELTKWMDCFGFWDDKEQLTRHTQLMVWNDAATAVRLLVFTYVLQRLLRLHDSRTALRERILRTAMDHYLLLASDAFYNPRTNHGFFQNACMLCFCSSLPQINGARLAFALSEKRLLTMLDERVSLEGFLKEHSTSYHVFFLACHIELLKYIPVSLQTRNSVQQSIQKMLSVFRRFILPDGSQALLGDSYCSIIEPKMLEYLQAHPEPEASPVTVYPSAGYGFLHSAPTQSHVILAGAFHSRVHKHCDELHVLWSEGTENILVDSGMIGYLGKILPSDPRFAKGFWYSDPKRIYAESVHAHNCVEINGESYSRKVNPYGALPITGGQASGTSLYLKSKWARPDGYKQNRMIVLQPGQWLLVLDRLDPKDTAVQKTRFSQWFHLGPQARLASLEQAERHEHRYAFTFPSCTLWCQPLMPVGSSSTHFAETEPRLQGWVAKQKDSLVPAYAVGYHVESQTAQFATLFTLNKTATDYKSLITKKGMQIVELTFSDGSADSFCI